MNKDNYCSLGMCQKLVEAGIMLETDVYWIRIANSPILCALMFNAMGMLHEMLKRKNAEDKALPYSCGKMEGRNEDNKA